MSKSWHHIVAQLIKLQKYNDALAHLSAAASRYDRKNPFRVLTIPSLITYISLTGLRTFDLEKKLLRPPSSKMVDLIFALPAVEQALRKVPKPALLEWEAMWCYETQKQEKFWSIYQNFTKDPLGKIWIEDPKVLFDILKVEPGVYTLQLDRVAYDTRLNFTPYTYDPPALVPHAKAPPLSDVVEAVADGKVVLLFGPSGDGKTTTALHVAKQVGVRTLVLHGDELQHLKNGRLRTLVNAFGFDTIIVDDMVGDWNSILQDFESIQGIRTILTMMVQEGVPKLQGLRPGRLDAVFQFGTPLLEDQLRILQTLNPNQDWSTFTEDLTGMTPAYLAHLAASSDPRKALTSLKLQLQINQK